MITKPLESLAHAPPLPKLHEYQLNGFENPSIVMKIDLTHGIPDVADWKPLEQFTTARFGLLSCLQSLPKDLQFDDTERSLDAQGPWSLDRNRQNGRKPARYQDTNEHGLGSARP